MDLCYSAARDILSPAGFITALILVLRLCVGGCLYMAPVCSSWVWINRSTSGRKPWEPNGDISKLYVRQGNEMMSRVAFLAYVAFCRGCHFFIEQPMSSLVRFYGRFIWLCRRVKKVLVTHARAKGVSCLGKISMTILMIRGRIVQATAVCF